MRRHTRGWDGPTGLSGSFNGISDRAQTLERAFELAQQAVTLDDSLSESHWLLGRVYVWKKQHEQALVEAERALALDPNNADGYWNLGNILTFAGRPEEGIEVIEQGMRLNPRYQPSDLLQFRLCLSRGGAV